MGCGLMDQFREPARYSELRKDDKDPLHVFSCGPEALEKAFRELNIHISQEDISHAIQKSHKFNSLIRDVAAIFNNEARRITFPEEMINALKDKGYSVERGKEYSSLNKTIDIAIILIKEKNTLNYHWMCFPVDKNILTFFGKDTVVKETYLIIK
jgi:hypothetical protein